MTLTLPDGEVVTHGYDAGGNLNHIKGSLNGIDYEYLQSLTYDEFEQRSRMRLGNGVETRYSYDPEHRRLCRLQSAVPVAADEAADNADSNADDNCQTLARDNRNEQEQSALSTALNNIGPARIGQFQNQHYAYDRVGNIIGIGNAVQTPKSNELGGPMVQTFQYDDLYRLSTANGLLSQARNGQNVYTLDMEYDNIHNIVSKDQTNVIKRNGDKERILRATTYDWGYAYTGQQPHAPTTIGNRTFSYDANGNQLGWESTVNGTRRQIEWDDENRIQKIGDPQNTLTFAYDDSGTRVLKRDQLGQTEYVNQFFSVRNEALASKHIFAGTSRIATKVEPGQPVGTDPSAGSSTTITTTTTATEQPVQSKKPVDKGNQPTKPEPQEKGFFDKLADFVNPGQGRDKRSDRANEVAQDVNKNPTLTGEFPGQGKGNNGKTPPGQGGDNPGQGQGQGQGPVDPGNGNGNNGNGNGNGSAPVQSEGGVFLYYYHPDHLGSTGYVTDENAELYEHIQYFPFGETWYQASANSEQRVAYRYTSKELDEEIGLYYYGARYYDPRTSVWQSADRILGSYLPSGDKERDANLPGMGGVFTSANLGLYTYTHQNPVRLIDPDGNAPDFFESRRRHQNAVSAQVARLKKQGYTRFEYEVRLRIKTGEDDFTIRVADIAAMKPGQGLSDASFYEVKTVKKRQKGGIFKKLARRLNRLQDVKEIGTKVVRGATMINQLRKDILLNESGATIERTGETIDSATMNWTIFEYKGDKGPLKRKGPTVPIIRGNQETIDALEKAAKSF